MYSCWGCRKQYELNSLRAETERFKSGKEYKDLQEQLNQEHAHRLAAEQKLQDYSDYNNWKYKGNHFERKFNNAQKGLEYYRRLDKENKDEISRLKEVIRRQEKEYQKMMLEWEKRCDDLARPYLEAIRKANELTKEKSDQSCAESSSPVNAGSESAVDPETLRNTINDLSSQLKAAKAQLKNNNSNCSLPSSMCINKEKIPNNRESSGLKTGGQPGHKGHGRKKLTPDVIVKLKVPDEILENPDGYRKTGEKKVKQLHSIRLVVQVVQYEAEVYKRLSDGKNVWARFPHGIVNDITYDASIKALACILHSHGNMSYDKVRIILSELTDGKLNLSTGFLNGLEREFSDKTLLDREHIRQRMLNYPYMHVDGTTIYVNGKRRTILVCTSPAGTLYYYSQSKGHKAVQKSVLKDYKGIVISDGESTFFNYGENHQGCLEHELRYLKGSMETEVNLTWAGKMRKLLKHAIHERNKAVKEGRDHLDEELIKEIETEYDNYLVLAEEEYKANQKQIKYYNKGCNTMIRLRDHKQYYLLFLHDLRIPPTNSRAEQKARPAKMHVKQSGGYRDEDGFSAQFYCDTLSVMACTADRCGSRYRMMLSVFGRDMPEERASRKLFKEAQKEIIKNA